MDGSCKLRAQPKPPDLPGDRHAAHARGCAGRARAGWRGRTHALPGAPRSWWPPGRRPRHGRPRRHRPWRLRCCSAAVCGPVLQRRRAATAVHTITATAAAAARQQVFEQAQHLGLQVGPQAAGEGQTGRVVLRSQGEPAGDGQKQVGPGQGEKGGSRAGPRTPCTTLPPQNSAPAPPLPRARTGSASRSQRCLSSCAVPNSSPRCGRSRPAGRPAEGSTQASSTGSTHCLCGVRRGRGSAGEGTITADNRHCATAPQRCAVAVPPWVPRSRAPQHSVVSAASTQRLGYRCQCQWITWRCAGPRTTAAVPLRRYRPRPQAQ